MMPKMIYSWPSGGLSAKIGSGQLYSLLIHATNARGIRAWMT